MACLIFMQNSSMFKGVSMKKLGHGVLSLLALIGIAHGATLREPTDVELKGQYCLGILDRQITETTKSLANDAKWLQEHQEKFEAATNENVAEIWMRAIKSDKVGQQISLKNLEVYRGTQRRLLAYVEPRRKFLAEDPMRRASSRASEDYDSFVEAQLLCVDKCSKESDATKDFSIAKTKACTDAGDENFKELYTRIGMCFKSEFLPF